MEDYKKDYVGSCVRGIHPGLLIKMKSGFAVMCDTQFLPGYCALLGYPEPYSKVTSLNELPLEKRIQYLSDMTLIGDAIMKVCNPLRINYSILMNSAQFLHVHIEARYDWEPDKYRTMPTWIYPVEERYHEKYALDEQKHGALKKKLTETLKELMIKTYGDDFNLDS